LLKSRLQPSCARPFKIPLSSQKSSGYSLLQVIYLALCRNHVIISLLYAYARIWGRNLK
jgi:hypothetical protein